MKLDRRYHFFMKLQILWGKLLVLCWPVQDDNFFCLHNRDYIRSWLVGSQRLNGWTLPLLTLQTLWSQRPRPVRMCHSRVLESQEASLRRQLDLAVGRHRWLAPHGVALLRVQWRGARLRQSLVQQWESSHLCGVRLHLSQPLRVALRHHSRGAALLRPAPEQRVRQQSHAYRLAHPNVDNFRHRQLCRAAKSRDEAARHCGNAIGSYWSCRLRERSNWRLHWIDSMRCVTMIYCDVTQKYNYELCEFIDVAYVSPFFLVIDIIPCDWN